MSDEEEMPIKIPRRKRKSAKPVEKKKARKKRKFTRIPKHNLRLDDLLELEPPKANPKPRIQLQVSKIPSKKL